MGKGTTSEAAEKLNPNTSAAKAITENKLLIAAVNRCATQNQVQNGVFPQPLQACQPSPKTRL
jgi:hypothetical protein